MARPSTGTSTYSRVTTMGSSLARMAKATTERVSALLRPPAGTIDLHGVDTRATPGFGGGKAKARKAQAGTAERLSGLQEQLYAEGRSGGTRSVLLVLQGMDT